MTILYALLDPLVLVLVTIQLNLYMTLLYSYSLETLTDNFVVIVVLTFICEL